MLFWGEIAFSQKFSPPYKVFFELKAGFQREQIKLTDPGNKLSNRLTPYPTTGANIGFLLNNNRSAITLEFDKMAIGNMPYFDTLKQSLAADIRFLRFSTLFQHQIPLISKADNRKLSLLLKAGPNMTFRNEQTGTNLHTSLGASINNSDTAQYDNFSLLNRNIFAGLTLSGGLLFTPNPRLRFSYNFFPAWNVSSNDVVIQDIRYRFFNVPTIYQAKAINSGNTLTHSLAMGYTFGKTQQRKEQIEKKKQLYTPEEWEKRKRWSLVLHTSNTYPVVNLSDPAGYLTKEPV
jgi:hypothetical protein